MSLDFDSAQLPNPNLTDLHHAWREQLRRFIDVEIMPYADDWDEAGEIPIGLWPKAAEVGLLGLSYPEAYGGTPGDVWLGQITAEELGRVGAGGINASLMVHNIGLPPIINWGSQTMKDAIAPPILRGEAWISLGITEPGGGSDVANLQTTAVRDGDDYVVNGSKTYITGGMRANWVSTAVRTGGEGAGGVSMLLIPTDAEGFSRTPLNRKQGWWASDTATLYFDNVRVPATQLIGEENQGFRVIMTNFNSERMGMAIHMEAAARVCMEEAVSWARERKTFGNSIFDYQNTQYKLAECKATWMAARAMVDQLLAQLLEGRLDANSAAAAKFWCTERENEVIDDCLQFFGGYGYMDEYPISRMYTDARVQRIYGGSNEIMRMLVARAL